MAGLGRQSVKSHKGTQMAKGLSVIVGTGKSARKFKTVAAAKKFCDKRPGKLLVRMA